MGRKRNNSTKSTQRDTSDIATDSEVLRSFIKKTTQVQPLRPFVTTKPNLASFDGRTYHPTPASRPISEPKSASRLKVLQKSAVSPQRSVQDRLGNSRTPPLSHRLVFSAPKAVTVCVRRKTRREVLFAKQRTGKGARSRKTRNQWSSISC